MKKTSNHTYVRRQFYISSEQSAFLREVAHRRHLSQARIVRDAIRYWAMKAEKVDLQPEPESMV